MQKTSYKKAGVDVEKGNRVIRDTKSLIQSTYTKNVLSSVGGFGGLFEIPAHYQKPVLVSSTDGVGTKLKVAVIAGKHDTVGEDLVNHCINDIAVLGAKPLYFLDYFATASLDETVFNDIISGFVRGCKNADMALIGGETAEMPGIYQKNDYDLCGTIVGIVEKSSIIDGTKINRGDAIIGVQSNGLHTNGYSLARKVLFEKYKIDGYIDEFGCTLAEELLRVHKSYLNVITETAEGSAKGFAHITGGGIIGNTKRIIPEGLSLRIDWQSWEEQAIFDLIKKSGKIADEDMREAFNLGIGLTIICAPDKTGKILNTLRKNNEKAWVIGAVE